VDKKPVLVVGVIVVLVCLGIGFVTSRFIDHQEILRAKLAAARLEAQREMLQMEVARRDSLQRLLEVKVDTLQIQAQALRDEVAALESSRAAAQLEVRLLRTPAELLARLEETFPEVGGDLWRRTEVADRENDVTLEYLGAPLWFFETFILDAQNADSYRAQRDRLHDLDAVQVQVVALQDSVITLVREKEGIYQAVYDSCYTEYASLNEKYVALLEKPPQVKVGGGWLTTLIAAGAGVAIGASF